MSMKVNINKKGIRALGIAESFRKEQTSSILCGVVMRADFIIDGAAFSRAKVGGNDSTKSIVSLYRKLERNDINVIILSGCIISYYNIVDIDSVARRTSRPVICLTYKESAGIQEKITSLFPDDKEKLELYKKLGERKEFTLKTGKKVYLRTSGLSLEKAGRVVDLFTVQGSLPEPVKVAKIIARTLLNFVSA